MHTECRREYTKPEESDVPPKGDSAKRLTRSSARGFDFRLNCFLYARFFTSREEQSDKVHVGQYKSKEVADVILRRQNDEWSYEVESRLAFVTDLRAEDAIYYRDCNSSFQSVKKKPGVDIATSSGKRVRPTINV